MAVTVCDGQRVALSGPLRAASRKKPHWRERAFRGRIGLAQLSLPVVERGLRDAFTGTEFHHSGPSSSAKQ